MKHPATSIRFSARALLLALGAAGCDQLPLHDLGYTEGDPPTGGAAPALPPLPVAQHALDFVGVWIGSVEDPLALQSNADDSPPLFRFPSGSTRIRLELTPPPDDDLFPEGTLEFGEGAPPPLDPDPNVGYPVEPDLSSRTPAADGSVRPPVEGFGYYLSPVVTQRDAAAAAGDDFAFVTQGLSADGKLDLAYFPSEVFAPWCALQTRESCPSDAGRVIDDDGQCFFGSDGFTPVDCMKMAQCASAVCSCYEENGGYCTSSWERESQLTVRFSEADGLVGLFSNAFFMNERGFQQPLGTLHFRREAAEAQP